MNKAELSTRVAARTSLCKQSAEGTGCLHDAVLPLAVTPTASPCNSYNQTILSFPTNSNAARPQTRSVPHLDSSGSTDKRRQIRHSRYRRSVTPARICTGPAWRRVIHHPMNRSGALDSRHFHEGNMLWS